MGTLLAGGTARLTLSRRTGTSHYFITKGAASAASLAGELRHAR